MEEEVGIKREEDQMKKCKIWKIKDNNNKKKKEN